MPFMTPLPAHNGHGLQPCPFFFTFFTRFFSKTGDIGNGLCYTGNVAVRHEHTSMSKCHCGGCRSLE